MEFEPFRKSGENMLKDLAIPYYFDEGYNCAEGIVRAGNEYYNLGLDDHAMLMVAGFGGGVQTGNLCGAVLGAVCLLSYRYVETKSHESEDIKPVVNLFFERLKEELGESLNCADVKPKFNTEENRCTKTVSMACDVLEKVIAEYENNKLEK